MFSSFEENVGLEERPFSHKAKPVAKAWPDPINLSEILEGKIDELINPLIAEEESTKLANMKNE